MYLFVVKLILLAVLCVFIYSQLQSYLHSDLFTAGNILSIVSKSRFAIALVAAIMPINWLIEAIKWKYICKQHQIEVSLQKAYASIYFGACAGFISPGRWGEPLARAYFIGKDNVSQKFFLSLIGIISQWIITILFALFSYLILEGSFDSFVLTTGLCLFFILLLFYYEVLFNMMGQRIKFFRKFPLYHTRAKYKIIIFSITLIRYLIYTLQYVLLMDVFIQKKEQVHAVLYTFQMFFLQSFSPFPGVVDYTFKNNIAIYLFQKMSLDIAEILFIVFVIWFINLVLPSIIGYVLFAKKLKEFWRNS